MERRHRGLARRGEWGPNLFAMSPREFFSASPFEVMRRFSEEMDRLFKGGREYGEVWTPDIEVKEENSNLVVCADLPGLSKDDVKVEATDEGLVIQGERKREEEHRERGYYRSERAYGRFYRLIPLPESAQLENAKAQFSNGVLEVVIPISEAEHKKREIPIEVEQAKTSGGGA
ncbi:MAG TPA: Hsp20/alpha crystallin family protein [Bryobacteraceae bacterium]|nr:Hsp20/alpha crystallin family protein [Bryobacteraceae bacterium]HPU70714.1 Hsp20/alpha crystallin family protein [Bryobacteraceae bacterium]